MAAGTATLVVEMVVELGSPTISHARSVYLSLSLYLPLSLALSTSPYRSIYLSRSVVVVTLRASTNMRIDRSQQYKYPKHDMIATFPRSPPKVISTPAAVGIPQESLPNIAQELIRVLDIVHTCIYTHVYMSTHLRSRL